MGPVLAYFSFLKRVKINSTSVFEAAYCMLSTVSGVGDIKMHKSWLLPLTISLCVCLSVKK